MATQKQKQAHAALRSLVQALEGGAVRPDSLCGCGGVIADPEDASVCSSCEEDQAIFDHEVRMEDRRVR